MILESKNGKKIYSDGESIELEILNIAKNYPEDLSQDYIADNNNYTINNTFSSVRQNILNWYPFTENADILEVGAGMGAITGMLCDKGRSVTAIEMNPRRADVIKARYPKRNNLTVINEDINTWKTDKKYDYIILVGVFEYAGIFSDADDPYQEFLENIKKFLKEDGIILLAIENRFGLKYLCGAAEDHIQKPFVGVEGYKEPKTPKTFSKYELDQMLVNTGFKYKRYYYVLPDYRFPQKIYTDEFLPSHLDLQKLPFTYAKGSLLILNEKELYKSIIENKVFPFCANSYLIEASPVGLPDKKVIHVSARGECKKEYRILTIIDNQGNVIKRPVHKNAEQHLQNIYENEKYLINRGIPVLKSTLENNTMISKYIDTKKADQIFESLLEQNDRKGIILLIEQLRSNLLKSSEFSEKTENIITKNNIGTEDYDYGPILKCGFIDMTFYNSFYINNTLVFFDQEWKFADVPLKFILYYAVKSIYMRTQVNTSIKYDEILEYLAIGQEKYIYDKLEEFIWSNILYRQGDFYGGDGYCNIYNDDLLLENAVMKIKQEYDEKISLLLGEISEKDNLISDLKQTISNKEGHINLLLESERTLKNEISEKDNLISDLKQTISNKEGHINLLLESERTLKNEISEKDNLISDLKQTISNKEGHINLLLESERTLKNEISEKDNLISDLKQTINNKEGHINLLLESDRELNCIKGSRAWRLVKIIWKITGTILPRGSKRRLFVRLLKDFILHPIIFLKKLKPRTVKNFFATLKREGTEGINYKLNNLLIHNQANPIIIEELPTNKDITDYQPLTFKAESIPLVSIIIPVYNQFEYTYNCLKSILKNSGDISYEIIIADDCSADLTTKIEQIVSNIKAIRNEQSLRFLKNCNNAARYANGKYVLFLNNDTQVQENWLAPLVELIENDNSIGMVGSKLVYADGKLQEAGGIFWNDASAWNFGNGHDPNEPEYNYVKEVDYISGASIMISKQLWNEIGGFDEQFAPAYYEDSDLAFEVRRRGYKVIYQPKSVVVHFEGISNGKDLTSGQKAYQIVNQTKIFKKWKEVLEKEHFPNGENVFLARDRSAQKKHILVVDHYVPHYDKDAGSKCTYMYIKLFSKLGLQVTFIGDNFYPHEPYTTELKQMGVEVLHGNYYYANWKKWLKENARYFDYAYLNRPHISIKYIDLIREYSKAKIIYFGHDLHYLRERRAYELTGDKKLLESSEEWKRKEFYLFSKADVIYVVGSYEQKILSEEFPNKPVRNIPVYFYDDIENKQPIQFNKRKDILFVGGFRHEPNIDAVLWFGKEIFPSVLEIYPDIKWYIVGSNPPKEILDLANDNIVVTGFVSDDKLASLYNSCRMAVAPLRYGAGVKGKVIESLYYRIPLITTSIGAEGLSLEENAFIVADEAKEFAKKIINTYNDFDKLIDLTLRGAMFIDKYFTTKVAQEVIEKDIIIE